MEAILIIVACLLYAVFNHYRIGNERKRSKNIFNKMFLSHMVFLKKVIEASENDVLKEHLGKTISSIKLDKQGLPIDAIMPCTEDRYVNEMAKKIDQIVKNNEVIEKELINIETKNKKITKIKLDLEKDKIRIEKRAIDVSALWDSKEERYRHEVEDIIDDGIARSHELSEQYIAICKEKNPILTLHQWMGEHISDLNRVVFDNVAISLKTKKHPSIRGSEKVSEMAAEVKRIRKESKVNEYTIRLYEHLFPWLEDFNDAPPAIITTPQDRHDVENSSINSKVESHLLTPEENNLSETERNQIKLNRYIRSNKSKWEIGILYERYVAYLYICDGWDVYMQGAIKGFEDMGRDLIARKGDVTKIIQCKNWSQTKTIYEKHIFQIFGTAVSYLVEKHGAEVSGNNYFSLFQQLKVVPVFYTSTTLSDQARVCAALLGVEIIENKKLEEFPMIKCNANSPEDKIYHLPFDQKYDVFQVKLYKGDKYVHTIKEAEEQGFRRAYWWLGANSG